MTGEVWWSGNRANISSAWACMCSFFFVNVVCSCLPFQTFQIVFPVLPLQTEECSEEDKRLKTKVFFLGGGWVVVVGVFCILLPPSVSNAFSAPRTKCLHHTGEAGREERREPLGRKTSGRVWKKIRERGGRGGGKRVWCRCGSIKMKF